MNVTTMYKTAWLLFERKRREAVENFNFLDPSETTSEERIFVSVLEQLFGQTKKGKKEA